MGKRGVSSPRAPKSKLPLSPATLAGNTLSLSGIAATDERGEMVGKDDIRARTRQVLENMKSLVEAAGGTLQDVTQTSVYITDPANYAGMNEAYQTYSPVDPPARATVRAGLANPDFLVEIQGSAVLG
jgi:aminoacrylate peracid reductase